MPRTAVVTGASGGIGAATARRLAKDGFMVVVADRREDRLSRLAAEIGGRAVRVDVEESWAGLDLSASLTSCDVLVNNADAVVDAEPVTVADVGDWERLYSLNVLGTLRVTQAMLPLLRLGHGGTIVTITSTAAFATQEGGGSYSAAKHAQRALTETLRLELCGAPVRVVEIAPGMVHAEDLPRKLFGGAHPETSIDAVDRPLTAEDVAECVAFAVGLPQHVNVDRLVVRPLAPAALHKIHQSPPFRAGISREATALGAFQQPQVFPGCIR